MYSPNTFFPHDFFEPINQMRPKSPEKIINQNKESTENKPKSIYIDITNEDEEDKELISLLEGKRMF